MPIFSILFIEVTSFVCGKPAGLLVCICKYSGKSTMLQIAGHFILSIATVGHPILPELREKLYQYNMPVHIGRNCWIGAGAVIMPGVTICDNTVIGAGSIVTKDIPAGVVAVGNPCRVMREINDHDKEFYFKNRRIELSDE